MCVEMLRQSRKNVQQVAELAIFINIKVCKCVRETNYTYKVRLPSDQTMHAEHYLPKLFRLQSNCPICLKVQRLQHLSLCLNLNSILRTCKCNSFQIDRPRTWKTWFIYMQCRLLSVNVLLFEGI